MANVDIDKEFDKQVKNIVKANVMVVGGTGVGKSSLINAVFGSEVAKVGTGKPQTKGIHVYDNANSPVVIFDTEGYEIFSGEIDNSNFKNVVLAEVEKRSNLELKEQIHLFWYCISAANHRLTNYDLENIKALNSMGVNLAVAITQCDTEELDDNDEGLTSKSFKEILSKEGIKQDRVFETIAIGDDKLQLDALIEWSVDKLTDNDLRAAFVGAQKRNLPLKDKEAATAIQIASAAAAAAAGANPFPLSDSVLLVPIQIGLAVKLASIYGFTSLGGNAMALLKTQVISLLGRQVAASLTKFIPIVGQVINAGVAGSLTLGLGYGLRGIYSSAYSEYIETGKEPNWAVIFKSLDLEGVFKKYISK